MDTVRQNCPQCRSTLELPASAVGRMARCPACQHTFRIEAVFPQPVFNQPLPSDTAPNPNAAAPQMAAPTWTSPTPKNNPYGTDDATSANANNPYAMTSGMAVASVAAPVNKGEIIIRRANLDRIISLSTAIFTARWQPLVLSGLIVLAASIGLGIVAWATGMIGAFQNPMQMTIIGFVSQLVIGLFSYYLYIGLIRVCLSVARGEPASPTQVFSPPGIVLQILVPLLLLTVIGALGQVGRLVIEDTEDLRSVFIMLGIGAGAGLLQTLILWFIWPALFLAADERCGNLEALSLGTKIATSNLLNGFLLGILSIILGVIGALTCGLGVIVTQPILALVATIAYLEMTTQPVSDPSNTPTPVPNYSYSPSKF